MIENNLITHSPHQVSHLIRKNIHQPLLLFLLAKLIETEYIIAILFWFITMIKKPNLQINTEFFEDSLSGLQIPEAIKITHSIDTQTFIK
jgi:hypothetical protein